MDRREAILARLTVVLAGIEGVTSFGRNRDDVSERQRPALRLLDADEAADEAAFERKRPAHAPNIVALTPEIYAVVAGEADEVGPAMSALRASVIKAVLTDHELLGLCVDGDIRYEGCATGFARGRTMNGEMLLQFTFNYLLDPARL